MSEWKECKLGDVCEFQEGYVNPSQNFSEYFDGNIKWLRATDLNNGNVYNTSRTLTEKGFLSAGKSAKLFKPNTIGISKSGTIGRLGILKDYMCGNRAVINIAPSEKVNTQFIYYSLLNRQEQFEHLAVGSVQKNLYVPILAELKIKLPSITKQNEIVKVLSAFDDKIELNNQINRNLEEQAQTIFKNWFADLEPFGGVKPSDWRNGTLSDIAEIKKKAFHPEKNPGLLVEHYSLPALDEKHYPVFEITDGIKSNKFVVTKESVLISKLNPDTKRIWRPYCISEYPICSTEFVVFEAKSGFHRDFIFSIIDGKQFYDFMCSLVTGCTNSHQRVPPETLLTFPVVIPPKDVLKAFCKIVSPYYDIIEKNVLENQHLANLRDGLLPKLMSGEMNVADIKI